MKCFCFFILLSCNIAQAQLEYLSPRFRATSKEFEQTKIGWRDYVNTRLSGAMFMNTKDIKADLPNLVVYADHDQITWIYSPDMMSVALSKVPFEGSLRIKGLAGITQDGKGNFWLTDSLKGRILHFQWNTSKVSLDFVKAFYGFNCPTSISYTEGSLTGPTLLLLERRSQAIKLLDPASGSVIRQKKRFEYLLADDMIVAWNPYFIGDQTLLPDPNRIYVTVNGAILEVSPITLDVIKTLYSYDDTQPQMFFPKDIVVTANGAILSRDARQFDLALFDPQGDLVWSSKNSSMTFKGLQHPAIYRQYAVVNEDLSIPGTAWELFNVRGFYADPPTVSDLRLNQSSLQPGDSLTGSFETNGRVRIQFTFTNSVRSYKWLDTLILSSGEHQFRYPSVPPVDGEWMLTATASGIQTGNSVSAAFNVLVGEQLSLIVDTTINGVRIPSFSIYKTEMTGDGDFAIDGYSIVRGKRPAEYYGRTAAMLLIERMNQIAGIPEILQPECRTKSKSGECKYTDYSTQLTKKGYRLPTMREWIRAYGVENSNWNSIAWYKANSASKKHPVGELTPNGWGLYDMSGNLPELVEEEFASFPSLNIVTGDTELRHKMQYPYVGFVPFPSWHAQRMGGGYVSDTSYITRNSVSRVPNEDYALSLTQQGFDNGGYMGIRPVFSDSIFSTPLVYVTVPTGQVRGGDSLRFTLDKSQAGRFFVRLVSPLGHVTEVSGFQDLVISDAWRVSEPKSWNMLSIGTSNHSTGPIPQCPGNWMILAAKASSRPVWDTSYFQVVVDTTRMVQVGPLLADKYEVTQGDFQSLMGYNPSIYKGNDWGEITNRPVDRVSFFQAILYCNLRSWIENLDLAYRMKCLELDVKGACVRAEVSWDSLSSGYRLPTEQEWRSLYGADSSGYFWNPSEDPAQYAWFAQPTSMATQSVGGRRPNKNGLYDMAGNVYEWVWGGDSINGIMKGGGKHSGLKFLNSSYTHASLKSNSAGVFGLRLVRSISAIQATHSLEVIGGYGSGRYRTGDSVTITTATAPPSPFAYWAGDVSVLPNSNQTYNRIAMPDYDVRLVAVYQASAQTYSVSVLNGTGSGIFHVSDRVCIHATVPDAFAFDKWMEQIPGIFTNSADPCFVMPAEDVTLTAQFIPISQAPQYEISIIGGTGSGRYASGTKVNIQAESNGIFLYWSPEEDKDTAFIEDRRSPLTTLLVQKNLKVTSVSMPYHTPKSYGLTVFRGIPSGSYYPGEEIVLTPDPAPDDSVFSGWISSLGWPKEISNPFLMIPFFFTLSATYASLADTLHDNSNPTAIPSPFTFESLKDWTGTGVSQFANSSASAGDACLCASVSSYSSLTSKTFSATDLGVIGDSLALDIRIGPNPPNPWWLGTAEVIVKSQASAYSGSLGTVSLTGLALEQWHTLRFALPQPLRALMGKDVRDFQISIILNGGGHVLCMDNIRFVGNTWDNLVKSWQSNCTGKGCSQNDPIILNANTSTQQVSGIGIRWIKVETNFVNWNPAGIHLQIQQTDGNPLTGYLSTGGVSTPLSGWSMEKVIPYSGQISVLIQIENYGSRTYSVNWWGS